MVICAFIKTTINKKHFNRIILTFKLVWCNCWSSGFTLLSVSKWARETILCDGVCGMCVLIGLCPRIDCKTQIWIFKAKHDTFKLMLILCIPFYAMMHIKHDSVNCVVQTYILTRFKVNNNFFFIFLFVHTWVENVLF